jgi:hypothetical protein
MAMLVGMGRSLMASKSKMAPLRGSRKSGSNIQLQESRAAAWKEAEEKGAALAKSRKEAKVTKNIIKELTRKIARLEAEVGKNVPVPNGAGNLAPTAPPPGES